MRDQVVCKQSNRHVASVQNNLAVGRYKGKNVALFRAGDCVIDCGNQIIVDFPSWKSLREMLDTSKPEMDLTVQMLLDVAGVAEEEVLTGNAEEVQPGQDKEQEPEAGKRDQPILSDSDLLGVFEPLRKRQAVSGPDMSKVETDPDAWVGMDLPEYPDNISLVSQEGSTAYDKLLQEAQTATVVAYDIQWAPDFDLDGSDNPVALMQLAFPSSANTYVVQLPLLTEGLPAQVRRLFESSGVKTVGFCADSTDVHKFEISGIRVHRRTLIDVQPWCEAEMGENRSVRQGWRVGLKRASSCVLDFEMDKTQTVASSNWEREELTTSQVEYGAMNVWATLRLYQHLAPAYSI